MERIGLSSNKLKIIAIIAMIIDHIAYYFYYTMSSQTYLCFRIIGRISMPIFLFLIVQGYFKTKNIKMYIIRIFQCAFITQILIFIGYKLNMIYAPEYQINVYKELNILFSFASTLLLFYIIDKKRVFSNIATYNYMIKTLFFISVVIVFTLVSIDYNMLIPIMGILLYFNEYLNSKDKYRYKIRLIIIFVFITLMQNDIGIFLILSLSFILMYNGKLGKNSALLKKAFYYIFPIQHFVLYILAVLVKSKYF